MLQDRGEETPLDHVPEEDYTYSWFVSAYYTLSNSRNESGGIPLSELKIYADNFGLIGSFEEFVSIIYALNHAHNVAQQNEREKKSKR